MKISDLRVGAVSYTVTGASVCGQWIDPRGTRSHHVLGVTSDIVRRIDGLREEMRDTMAVARGRVPRLREFTEGWGKDLLPPPVAESPPDVLVIVPHTMLHDVPIHLVRCGQAGEPLCCTVGITYSSSQTLFVRCVGRNPARAANPDFWTFDGNSTPQAHPLPATMKAGAADVLTGQHNAFLELAGALAPFFRGDVIVFGQEGFAYSRTAVKAAFRGEPPDVLCVVAHGYVDPQNHRFSGLMIQRDDVGVTRRAIPLHGGRYFDFRDPPLRDFPTSVRAACPAEVLTSAELEIDAHIRTHLVVLLACSAGWGRVLQGDEPASLAESFLHIGAPSVLAPMWDSDYEVTREWIHHFFTAWMHLGQPKALAVRHAMRTMYGGQCADRPERLGALALRGDWL
ncbi:MAG: CHAT domain-containing protein [Armatimonadota bacterium]